MILVDSSAWINVLRGRFQSEFADKTKRRTIVTCLPVIQEVLQGFGDDRAYALAAAGFRDMTVIEDPLTRALYDEAIQLYRVARRYGFTIRSSVDCVIAACAMRHDATVLHSDSDFTHLARVSSLRIRELIS